MSRRAQVSAFATVGLPSLLASPSMPNVRWSHLVATLLVVCAGCRSEQPAVTGGSTGGTIIVAAPSDPSTIFPPYVTEEAGRAIQDLIFNRLATIGPHMETVGDRSFTPELAQRWTWAPDSLSIAFSIDPHARWHDGQPVTARDVQYSFHVFSDPKTASPMASLMQNIDSVSVRDSLTAVVWFKKRTPEQFYDVAYQLVVFPQHVFGSIPDDQLRTAPATRTPVGSGPFRLVAWKAGQQLELVADTSYFLGRPMLDRIIFATEDPTTAATQVLTGQADFLESFPNDEAATLDSSKVARGVMIPTEGYVFLAMNAYAGSTNAPNPIFGDVRVRRALSMAVNRVGMLHNVFGASGVLSHGPFSSALSLADTTLPLPPYDTTAAKALLDSAGWRAASPGAVRVKSGKPLRFTLLTPSSSQQRRQYAVLIQDQLRRVGAQVDIDVVDPRAVFYPRMIAHDFDALMQGWSQDPSVTGMKQTWSTSGIGPDGQNFLRYSNPRVDALIDSAAASVDPAKAKRYASRAERAIIDDVPGIWLYDIAFLGAVNRRIDVAPMRADGWWVSLPKWSIPPAKRIARDRVGLAAGAR